MINIIARLAAFLSAIGAINWGLVEFFRFNFISFIGKYVQPSWRIEKILYALIALSGFYLLISIFYVR